MIGWPRLEYLDSNTLARFKVLAENSPRFLYRIWISDFGVCSRLVDCISAEKFTPPALTMALPQSSRAKIRNCSQTWYHFATHNTTDAPKIVYSRARVLFGPSRSFLHHDLSLYQRVKKFALTYTGIRLGKQLRSWKLQFGWVEWMDEWSNGVESW